MITKQAIEMNIKEYPIFEYAFLKTSDLNFYDNVRTICKNECPQYGKSWSCPPGVGSIEECRSRSLKYENVFVFSTVSEVKDICDMKEMLGTRGEHIEILNKVKNNVFNGCENILILTAESCEICEECTYPNDDCRHLDRMYPCIESYGISVTNLCENHHLSYLIGHNMIAWFALILY